ncbi:hypothetical protein OG21DRAFT_1518112, partial [Imleria badia]
MLFRHAATPFAYQKKRTLTRTRSPGMNHEGLLFAVFTPSGDLERDRGFAGLLDVVEGPSGGCKVWFLLVFLDLVRSHLSSIEMLLDGPGVPGFFGGDASGREVTDGGHGKDMCWSEHGGVTATSRGRAEDAGDGGSSDVSTKKGRRANHESV